jgi:diguanylate cyclase (GGDEF)-like protein
MAGPHLHDWRLASALLVLGLAGHAASTFLAAGMATPALGAALPTAFALAGNLFAVAGLVVLLHQRLPGRSAESVAAATIATTALGFSLLALVVVPAHGWEPARQLPALAIPLGEIMILYLASSLISLTGQHPRAYYLLAAAGCLLFAHAVEAPVLFGDAHVSSLPLDAVALWGVGLWGLAMIHPSQRQPFDPVSLRSPQPGWTHLALILLGVLVVPAVLTVQLRLRVRPDMRLTAGGAALLPVVAVMYLLYHVFARSVFEYRVQHDDLTGIGNRGLFQARLGTSLMDSRRTGRGLAVMFLDLDRFKSINDSLGHAVGSQLLQWVVQRLRGRLRAEDTLARAGGDEFTILFPNIAAKETCQNLAEQILELFAEPFHLGGELLPVQTSIGRRVPSLRRR